MSDYTRKKWLRIRALPALQKTRQRIFHASAELGTFNVGRNNAKREKRAAVKALRARLGT